MELTAIERRWAQKWATAFYPSEPGWPPISGALDDAFWRTLHRSAPALLLIGFRSALLLATSVRFGRSRQALLMRWRDSEIWALRQLVLVMRLVFSFAYFRDEPTRRRVR